MISAQTLRVCRRGKPLRTFADHALASATPTSRVFLVALQKLDRDALRAADETDAHALPDRRRLLGELDALRLHLGGNCIDVLHSQPEIIEPLAWCDRRAAHAVAPR